MTKQRTLNRRDFIRATASSTVAAAFVGCKHAQRGGDNTLSGAIDAHSHIWTPDVKSYPLGPWMAGKQMNPPSFTAEELLGIVRPSGVDRVVLIQHAPYHGYDNSYILDMVNQYEGTFSAVAMIDERLPDVKSRLAKLQAQGARGIRIGPTKHADRTPNPDPPNWLKTDGMQALWKAAGELGVYMQPLIGCKFLPTLEPVVRQFPNTVCIIDHFGHIHQDPAFGKSWMKKLAEYDNVLAKVSAFKNIGDKKAPYDDVIPFIEFMVETYGPDRLMWGSDCPYQILNGNNYPEGVALIRDEMDSLSRSDRDKIMRGTAERLYFS